jgi:hypothetical protein
MLPSPVLDLRCYRSLQGLIICASLREHESVGYDDLHFKFTFGKSMGAYFCSYIDFLLGLDNFFPIPYHLVYITIGPYLG